MRTLAAHWPEYAIEAGGLALFLLTDRVDGLDNCRELFACLQNPNGAIKIFCEVAPL